MCMEETTDPQCLDISWYISDPQLTTSSHDIRLPMAVACPSDLLPKLFNLALRLVPILDGKEQWESADGGWIFRGTMAMSRFWVDWQCFTKLWKLCLIMYWNIIKCHRVIFLLQFFNLRPHLQSLIYIGTQFWRETYAALVEPWDNYATKSYKPPPSQVFWWNVKGREKETWSERSRAVTGTKGVQ